MKIIIANSNPVYNYEKSQLSESYEVIVITTKNELNPEKIANINPDFIFFPHWSYMISPQIFNAYKCIVFHMTDLPYGRGGSPLQNLIVRGHSKTKISAIDVTKEIDAGDVYLKKQLSLHGTAHEVYSRAQIIIQDMIVEIIKKDLSPVPQNGDIVSFKRRSPSESNLGDLDDLNTVYDYIRMLDSKGYPHAFIETENLRFEFFGALSKNDSIEANVRITKK